MTDAGDKTNVIYSTASFKSNNNWATELTVVTNYIMNFLIMGVTL